VSVDRLGAHQTAEMVKRVAEIVVRLGEGWSEAESLSIARLRLRPASAVPARSVTERGLGFFT
jgi:hypothetical protein